ncbi:hypothetical protein [Sulfurimonas paralvinellae]|uniref:Outer membrane protein beta-barrel domain-containing protein n=1 Tax=Sulfurimonas paralvinellae TaxID=317658 RepID=A0A7M1B9R4_9BACT|nr:hypothetical protein [Sulfurimonas paralvinellae]QOP46405.1 hypothetical protein FM071_08915 [Sulfurimonas paralvinellae]
MKKIFILCVALISLANADIFLRGNKNIGASIGAGRAYNQNYTVAGVYGNYFIADNLSVGVGYRAWMGGTPSMQELQLEGTYYLPLNRKFHPYIGVFGRNTFVSSYKDYQSYGARAGLAITTSKNSYVGLGYIIEYYSDCNRLGECSNSYPEVVVGLSF